MPGAGATMGPELIKTLKFAAIVAIRLGSRIGDVRETSSVQIASSSDLSSLLNMSATMVIPGDHCDMPPKWAWLNSTMPPS
jgi:hypothetical protein